MIPARFAPYLIALFLSGAMSCLVSGLATVRATGFVPGVFTLWMASWIFAWAIAFPALMFFRPIITRLVMRIVRDES